MQRMALQMIKDVVRLKWEAKLSHEQIAQTLSVSIFGGPDHSPSDNRFLGDTKGLDADVPLTSAVND